MKILFVVPYPPGESPSQRFRFEQYIATLTVNGHSLLIESFLNSDNWRHFFGRGKILKKGLALASGLGRRILILSRVPGYDFVFIHREAAPGGPPLFEWIIGKVLRKRIIYDFDDAIWLTDKTEETTFQRALRWRSKVKAICSWSYRVSCGNHFLADYASGFNPKVVVNPTTIDTVHLHNRALYESRGKTGSLTIGWTGSHSTMKYLTLLVPVIERLEKKHKSLRFLVIADKRPDFKLDSLVYRPWSLATEVSDLLEIDIGIMPLPDDDWSKGKCGFKALQYMALEIPAVVSAVGVNRSIIDHGKDGFLATTSEDWNAYLGALIGNKELRSSMGKKGREKVVQSYSVSANSSVFLSLFE